MKKCPNCNSIYKDYDQYCIKCNYKLCFIENSNIIDYCPNINTTKEKQQNQPKCPYCNSTNLSKISILNRAVSVGIFGLASGKVGKQWHCNNCKSNF